MLHCLRYMFAGNERYLTLNVAVALTNKIGGLLLPVKASNKIDRDVVAIKVNDQCCRCSSLR